MDFRGSLRAEWFLTELLLSNHLKLEMIFHSVQQKGGVQDGACQSNVFKPPPYWSTIEQDLEVVFGAELNTTFSL